MHNKEELEICSKYKRKPKAEWALELFSTKACTIELAKVSIRNKSRSIGSTHLTQDYSTDKEAEGCAF